ncbi:MAG: transglycosylase SLT domain-containing protein [Smithellaceae bacterium]
MEGKRRFYWLGLGLAGLVIVALLYLVIGKSADKQAIPVEEQKPRTLALTSKEWTGDFDKMLEQRRIRVLVPHSRSLYFNDKGRERGMIGESMRDFEHYLNKKYHKKLGRRPLTVFITPTTRDLLLMAVAKGQGDIAAGDITVTDERLKIVDFAVPEGGPQVSELLITGPRSPAVGSLEDLAGKTVHVRKSTSYYNSLLSLNERFKKEGGFWSRKKAPVKIILVPDALEDEDMLEMLNAGLFEFIVVDNVVAKMWAQVLPKINVRDDVVLRKDGKIGWAIRKGSPMLAAEILDFYKNYLKKQGVIESRLVQYHKRIRQISNPTGTAEWKRFEQTLALFEKYGQKYQFDPVMLAAQGYQESTLDQKKRSPVGAIGIMQIMPATGASLKVGNIEVTEPNIHAGTKYMDMLLMTYLQGKNLSEQDRTLLAFASYNAGPGNISRMRKLAKARGLDPDKWFNNVEVVTAEKLGLQTTTYVRNIYKYYIAYKLTLKTIAEKREAREQFATGKNKPGEK